MPYRANWIRATSSTGGAGDLVLSALTGWSMPDYAVGASSPARLFKYTITQFTDSTKTVPAQRERGIALYDPATHALKRGTGLARVTSTYVDSTGTYLPNPGSGTAPSPLSFSATSNLISIECTAAVEEGPWELPSVWSGRSFGTFDGVLPLNYTNVTGTYSATSGATIYFPATLVLPKPITTVTAWITAAATAGAHAIALHDVADDGSVGRQLANFGNFSTATTGGRTSTAALTNAIWPEPGQYYVAYLASGLTGALSLRAANCLVWGPLGVDLSGSPMIAAFVTGQSALNDPPTQPTAGLTGLLPFFAFK